MCSSDLATGVGLTQAISTRRGVGGGGAPTGLVVDDVVRSGEVRFAIPVIQQILMRPGLHFSSRNSAAGSLTTSPPPLLDQEGGDVAAPYVC